MTESSLENPVSHLGYRPFDLSAPAWLRDIARFLAIRSQFVLSGNVDDLMLMPAGDLALPVTLKDAISTLLEVSGYEFLICYDPFDYFQVYAPTEVSIAAAKTATGINFDNHGRAEASSDKLLQTIRNLVASRSPRGALLIEHAARFSDEDSRKLFGGCLKLSHSAPQLPMPDGRARFNPIFWVVDEPNDLPAWLTLRNERIRTQSIPKPDIDTRLRAASVLVGSLTGFNETPEIKRNEIIHDFARSTEGLTLSAMVSITQLARDQGYDFNHILDAVRLYKLGVTDNPWNKKALLKLIRDAESIIQQQVKGQHQAVVKTVDILKRSVTGLSGAQASSSPLSGRPRGVLFFAGPTGVGKTELAKSMTNVLFGNERAYIRFDMSEFAQEHTEARLIGAPPGYVGHDAGGELTKAIRERPFSVVLFDEIEKAHPRILDKFLQILEDGRLTDSHGETVYFTESIIVFTSNLGIYTELPGGERVANVDPSMGYDDIEHKIRTEINNFFKYKLARPEILNRLGDNIVIFNFINPLSASDIFDRQLENVEKRLNASLGIVLEISKEVRLKLLKQCTEDLSNGGRGIGNRLETVFINPLARVIFNDDFARNSVVRVNDCNFIDGVYSVNVL